MKKHSVSRVKTSICALYGSAGLADTFLTFGVTTLVMPIYNIGLGINAVMLGWALAIPRILDAITDPLMGNISDNTRSRFGRRRQYVFGGSVLCAILFPFIWMPPAASHTVMLIWFTGMMCLHAVFYTVFNVPYTALGYEVTPDYDERTRLFAWRFYFATAAGVAVQWLYRLCLLAGETEVEGIRIVSVVIAVAVLATGILPAIFTREKVIEQAQPKVKLFTALACAVKNRAFLTLMASYIIIVTTMFTCGALTLYINIFYIFEGDRSAGGTMMGIAGTVMIGAAFLGMLLMKKISELTGKKTAMLISLGIAILGTGVSWFTLNPELPWLQLISAVILGVGIQGCWLLVSSMVGDVCDDDELRTGLRQEGLYSAVSGFMNKVAFALTAITSGYVLQFSGYVEGETVPVEIGYRMKVIFVSLQATGLLAGLLLMTFFPINRARAEETRRILDEREQEEV